MKILREAVVFVLLLLFVSPVLVAQDNAVVDRFLQADPADASTTVYLSLIAGGYDDGVLRVEEALDRFVQEGYSTKLGAEEAVTAADFAHIAMQTMNIRGSLMYQLLGTPRYAFRTLQSYGIIGDNVAPRSVLSGETVLAYLGLATQWKERHQ